MMSEAPPRPLLLSQNSTTKSNGPAPRITARAFWLGLASSVGLAALNCWIEIVASVHFLGGVQMPFGSIFLLSFCILGLNGLLRKLAQSFPASLRRFGPLSPAELLTIYSMALFAALISTPGADNFFLTVAPCLFYFASRENRWADLFYDHVPWWFAPGWDGHTYRREVIEPLFTGGLTLGEIPWHAWAPVLIAWSVLLVCAYATLFFGALLLRRQWIENEALTFPLVQLPLQMVEIGSAETRPTSQGFWSNGALWLGVAVAFSFHLLRGMNQYFPDWPRLAGFQNGAIVMTFTERPWDVVGGLGIELYLGAVGIAFLLTREVAFSFWFFFLAMLFQLVLAEQLGFGTAALPRDSYRGHPTFITFQSVGGWLMVGLSLLWTARAHFSMMLKSAWRGEKLPNEPFSPRLVVGGFTLSVSGLLAWTWCAGINPLIAPLFFALYLGVSLVIARLVVEGGLLFPQLPFAPMEVLTSAITGTAAVGAPSLTRLVMLQPSLLSDTRTNLLPGFLHTLKLAHELKLDAVQSRRLMLCVATAVVTTLGVTIFVSLATLYSVGGLSGYNWFTQGGGRLVFTSAASMLSQNAGVEPNNLAWIGVGALITFGLGATRSRFAWFPLHPLGYIVASSYPITKLWFSFFIGWLVKTLLSKYGGHASAQRAQPFMLGLVLGNAAAMVLWMLIGLRQGVQITYWPA